MCLSYYTLEKMVEIRLAERREEAARERAVAPAEEPAQPVAPGPFRWIQAQILGR
jgi:hypothetical protein